MELLNKVFEFTKSIEDKREIYILYIIGIRQQSCVVWHSSLSKKMYLIWKELKIWYKINSR